MPKKAVLPVSPVFIPKVNSDISKLGLGCIVLWVQAKDLIWRPGILQPLRGMAKFLLVDPLTHHLLYEGSRDNGNFEKLPYAGTFTIEDLYSNSDLRVEKLVKPCVEFQVAQDADAIIAPYFFAEDSDDAKFVLNISMLAETIRVKEELGLKQPIFAMIYVGGNVLSRQSVLNFIIDRYREGYEEKIDGYIVRINELETRKTGDAVLQGLAYMIFQLSRQHTVIVSPNGTFGEVLSAVGADGFSGGLGTGEVSSVKGLQDGQGAFDNRSSEWTYVPELMDYVNDAELKKIGYKCDCPACSGGVPSNIQEKKKHFFFRRMAVMEAMAKMNRDQRISYMIERLEKAETLANSYIRKHGSALKVNHLRAWKNVLISAKEWTYDDENEDGLDELLADLEKKSDD